MHTRDFVLSTPGATSAWRQGCRQPRRTAGRLDILNSEVLGRFLDEGVPEADALYVAAETRRCVRDLEAGEELPEELHPWTREILARYEDKVASLFFTLGGGKMVRV
jgi:hypothetical protein